MSERITWEACPVCGAAAAVGWRHTDAPEGEPQPGESHEHPIEFDCPNGCRLSELELVRAFA